MFCFILKAKKFVNFETMVDGFRMQQGKKVLELKAAFHLASLVAEENFHRRGQSAIHP